MYGVISIVSCIFIVIFIFFAFLSNSHLKEDDQACNECCNRVHNNSILGLIISVLNAFIFLGLWYFYGGGKQHTENIISNVNDFANNKK